MTGSAITGTVSVVDLTSMKVTDTISTGLHPTGMALFGEHLLVANTYSDTISVIDTATNKVMRTIDLGLPIKVPGHSTSRPMAPGRTRSPSMPRRHCLRRALQCQRDRGRRPERRRERARPGHDPGGLCAELGRARHGRQRS